ncbi:AAA family ATPase [Paenibacillus protaetiae]|uniref:AAA family ATPase n=1 Tax=Paenibacillus protaetiae TaxID=2509456 RepID=A0A4P6EV16_9BACL|nr:AAA family ATPase [Paenibacillus protaetiae]QAY67110.1 AAA family ATPase [Paenibacillus protaetiae]
MFLREITKMNDRISPHMQEQYPFNIPSIRSLERLRLTKRVTFLVGENGSGKSTLLEAMAYQCGFHTGGGGRNNQYTLDSSEAALSDYLRLSWLPKVTNGFFLRAESFYQFSAHIDEMVRENPGEAWLIYRPYGGKSLFQQSHGESFFALFQNRFGKRGIYLLDEPEAALSPSRQLAFLSILHTLQRSAQLIIATHSPILLGYPGADIISFDGGNIHPVSYEETDHYQVTRRFLENRKMYLNELLD